MAEWNEVLLNPFFLISQFAFWVNLLLFVILSRRSRSTRERVSSFLILSFAIWSLGDSMMRASANSRMGVFWNNVSGIGWCFLPSIYLQTAALMRGRGRKLGAIYVPSLVFLMQLWFTPHINSGVTLTRWGYSAVLGQYVWTYLLYSIICFVSGLVLLFRSKRTILKWLAFTTLVMLILGSATDLILPWIGIRVELFPLFTVPISVVLFIACGTWEHPR